MPENDLLIIGFGNPLRGDDGLGWRAAERLSAADRPGRRVITCQQLTPDLAEPLSQTGRVVFIDAAVDGEPGQIKIHSLTPAPPEPGAFSHQLTPAGLLSLAALWYGGAPQAELITVAGAQFAFSESLSPAVDAAVENVVRWVQSL
ncbi:MAG: hydrogenase maturation protease [Anaerolineales bacterium]|nr:hydrogenase maturation protease [Anaerolineales bacterium]